MRFQSLARLIAIGLIAAAGVMLLSINRDARSAEAQAAATATSQSASSPITGVPLTYTVKSGDSFNAIARQFNLMPQQLQALNAISNTNLIRVGQALIVAVSTFTPTPVPSQTSAPTATAIPAETTTPLPIATPTVEPTVTPTRTPASTDQPVTIPAHKSIAPPAPRSPVGIPLDVIFVSAVMFFAVVGLIIGFRTQRR